MAKRPTPHVDTSMHEANPDAFVPAPITADAPTTHVKVGLHGDNGTGKTLAAGTFPKPIFLSFDPGYSSLRQLNNAKDIQIIPIADKVGVGADGKPVLERGALQILWDHYRWLKSGNHDRETAVIDSFTEIGKVALEAVMRKQRNRPAPGVPDTDDYIEANAKLTSLIRYFRDLPMHVVFLGHSKVLKNKDTVTGVRFDLSDKLATALGGACDVVMHTMVTSVQTEAGGTVARWVGATVPINGVQAKDRSGLMRKPTAPLHFNVIAQAYGLPFTDTRVVTSTDMHDEAGDEPTRQERSSSPAAEDGAPTPTVDAAVAEAAADAVQTPEACATCGGSGEGATPKDTCDTCGGTGEA